MLVLYAGDMVAHDLLWVAVVRVFASAGVTAVNKFGGNAVIGGPLLLTVTACGWLPGGVAGDMVAHDLLYMGCRAPQVLMWQLSCPLPLTLLPVYVDLICR
jgi:hypothetical protein